MNFYLELKKTYKKMLEKQETTYIQYRLYSIFFDYDKIVIRFGNEREELYCTYSPGLINYYYNLILDLFKKLALKYAYTTIDLIEKEKTSSMILDGLNERGDFYVN